MTLEELLAIIDGPVMDRVRGAKEGEPSEDYRLGALGGCYALLTELRERGLI